MGPYKTKKFFKFLKFHIWVCCICIIFSSPSIPPMSSNTPSSIHYLFFLWFIWIVKFFILFWNKKARVSFFFWHEAPGPLNFLGNTVYLNKLYQPPGWGLGQQTHLLYVREKICSKLMEYLVIVMHIKILKLWIWKFHQVGVHGGIKRVFLPV